MPPAVRAARRRRCRRCRRCSRRCSGENPVEHLLRPAARWRRCRRRASETLTGTTFFPHLLAGPFHDGLVVVFSVAAVLSVLGAVASLLRGPRVAPGSGR